MRKAALRLAVWSLGFALGGPPSAAVEVKVPPAGEAAGIPSLAPAAPLVSVAPVTQDAPLLPAAPAPAVPALAPVLLPSYQKVPSRAERKDGLEDFISVALAPFDLTRGLHLAPGRILEYPEESVLAGSLRFDGMSLLVGRHGPQELPRVAEDLAQGGDAAPVLRKLKRALRGEGSLPLRTLLPAAPRALTGKNAECDGPNCFNATLLWDEPEMGSDHVFGPEMEFRLGFTHAPLKPGEPLRFGDVLAVHVLGRRGPELVHTARVLNAGFVWHKASQFAADPYTFESLRGAVRYYWENYRRKVRLEFLRRYRTAKTEVLGPKAGSGSPSPL